MGNSSLPYSILPHDDAYIELERISSTPLPPSFSPPPPPSLIKLQVLAGNMPQALTNLREGYEQLITPGSPVYLSLHTQAFIELLRLKQSSQALKYAQMHLAEYRDRHFKTVKAELRIRDLMGLMCFEEPKESAVGYLMQEEQRKVTAQVVLRAIDSINASGRKCSCFRLCRCFRVSRPH